MSTTTENVENMISDYSPKRLKLLLICVLGFFTAALVTLFIQHDKLKTQVAALSVPKAQETSAEFDAKVAQAVERLVTAKHAAESEERYAQYQLAADVVPNGARIYGSPQARFTIVEYSDLECHFCKKFHATPKNIVDASNGNVNWQWKHLPLSFHNPGAHVQAVAAECVAEQKGNKGFWVFIDEIFKNTRGNGEGVADLGSVVQSVGADKAQFNECMTEGKFQSVVDADLQKATELGITGTPSSFIVDNVTGKSQEIQGAQPEAAVVAIIRAMMETDANAGAVSQ